ncbi:conserved oligomeric Golgi complex subunit 8 [Striga asiatica]|uniref:Conserved oligomeric Golgi complex subunit 8 n=1 Tax=Striga asiatica TaxID=4170 RepID=A0A5A7RDD7_STRAF|nr:conserved oligomeric Golgi complex subunit 8 [Striga asiatica]
MDINLDGDWNGANIGADDIFGSKRKVPSSQESEKSHTLDNFRQTQFPNIPQPQIPPPFQVPNGYRIFQTCLHSKPHNFHLKLDRDKHLGNIKLKRQLPDGNKKIKKDICDYSMVLPSAINPGDNKSRRQQNLGGNRITAATSTLILVARDEGIT